MQRRPLLLITLALVTMLGLAADLTWRTQMRSGETENAHRTAFAQTDPEVQLQADLTDKLSARHNESERAALTSRGEVQRDLNGPPPVMVEAVMILVDGQEIVAVPDEEQALAVKEKLLADYQEAVLEQATAIEALGFRQQVEWKLTTVPESRVHSTDQTLDILRYGTDKVVSYTVQPGDTGWDIAIAYAVSTEKLADANPAVNLDSLQIGQKLNVTFNDPYVYIDSVSQRIRREGVPFSEQVNEDPSLWPWQYEVITPGVWGTRELTLREYRENGKLVETDVLENKVVQAPRQQVSRQGTRQIPALGTGSLVYPVVGQTTSMFGPRWGSYHEGIDIAAPTGTPVLAADSGMVVFRGWSGNYGNLIKIDHGEGRMVTWYAHLNQFNLNLGDTVRKGDLIGYVGNTGYSTGPHLHYEVHEYGRPVNPLSFYQ